MKRRSVLGSLMKIGRSSSGEEEKQRKKRQRADGGGPAKRVLTASNSQYTLGAGQDDDKIRDHPLNELLKDQLLARLVMLGGRRVGTSSLIKRYTGRAFSERYSPEQAKVVRHTKRIFITRLGSPVTVQFWDVEGADTEVGLMCAQKAHAVAVLYDVTNRSSFETAQHLLDNINPRASTLLVATKIDMRDSRRVSFEEGRLLAKIHRVEFIETSAKLNYNVDEAIQLFLSTVPDEYLRSSESAALRRWRTSTSAVLCALCQQRIQQHHTDTLQAQRKKRHQSH